MSWNRQYRPRTVSELHLTSVSSMLQKLMASGSFPQVFLFTGPKGTGKTSTARIIGALLNDVKNAETVSTIFSKKQKSKTPLSEPQNKDGSLDTIFSGESYLVQEMDAASNRGIDDIRSLKEKIQLPPIGGSMAVYILDEVHMLTTEAFNALLKLLEEPPSHAIFILATTELHKVPETVISRCNVITFSKASIEELSSALKNIAKKESLKVADEVLKYISQQANGSFRDAVKFLEQAAQSGSLELDQVETLLGRNYSKDISKLIEVIIEKDMKEVSQLFEQLREVSINEAAFHKDILSYLHQQLLQGLGVLKEKANMQPEVARFLLSEFSSSELSNNTAIPLLKLELKSLEIIERALKRAGNPPSPSQVTKKHISSSKIKTDKVRVENLEAVASDPLIEINDSVVEIASESLGSDELSGNGELLFQEWNSFLTEVAQQNFSLATLLKSAHPVAGDTGQLTLSVYYKFHQEQLSQPKFQDMLNKLISTTYGSVKINCILADHPPEAELREPTVDTQLEKLAVDALM